MDGAVSLSVVETGGEEVGFTSQSMNNPSLAYDGLTLMDVPADMHTRKAWIHDSRMGILPGMAILTLLVKYLK